MIIQTESLNKAFRRRVALCGVSLAVPEGSIYALIGPNGAGKTTTIKTLLNILMPTSGRADVLGVDSRRLAAREYAKIGYVSENQQLPRSLPVAAYLAYVRRLYPTWDAALEAELTAAFQLPLQQKIKELSHGTRMKLAFTAALAYRPSLLVLDEPFGGLDALVRDELMERLLRQAQEMTVFLSSHELDEIEASVTHVGYLEVGHLLFQETMESLAARVREVRVICPGPTSAPAKVPDNWLNLAADGRVVSFVDVKYSQEALQADIEAVFPGPRELEIQPVPLRSIFTALARAQQNRVQR